MMIPFFRLSLAASIVLLTVVHPADAQRNVEAAAPSVGGVYQLYPVGAENGSPIAKMLITWREDQYFSVRGLGQTWSGEGRIEEGKGFYNWIFENGDSGKTTLTVNADGTLNGHVVGSGLNWMYLARKSVVSSQIAADPRGYVVATRENDGEDSSLLLYEAVTGQLRRRLPGRVSASEAVAFTSNGSRLITVGPNVAERSWDVGLFAAAQSRKPASAADLDKAWGALTQPDAVAAYAALLALASSPEQALAIIRKHVRPVPRLDAAELERIIADLDSEVFTKRQKATSDLDKLGRPAALVVRHRMEKVSSLELKRRLANFASRYETGLLPEEIRAVRVLEFLENFGDLAVREVVGELAAGEPTADLTIRAVAAKARLNRVGLD
jgi:hypothetical protein